MKVRHLFLSNWVHLIGAVVFYYFVSTRHLYIQEGLDQSFDISSFLEIIPTAILPTIFGIIGYFWLMILLIVAGVAIVSVMLYYYLLTSFFEEKTKRLFYTSMGVILISVVLCIVIYPPLLFAIPVLMIGERIKYKKMCKL